MADEVLEEVKNLAEPAVEKPVPGNLSGRFDGEDAAGRTGRNRAVYVAIGIHEDGGKEVLGLWSSAN